MAQAEGALRLPIRSATVELDGDYAGFMCKMRLNPRRSVVQGMTLGEIRALSESLAKVIISWNFVDEDGEPLEITPENIHDLPDDLLGATMTGYFAKFTKETEVPKEPPTPSTTT